MALDIARIRARLDNVKNNGKAGGSFWRPKDGTQTIRIVPTQDGDPFKDYWFHYNLGPDQRGGLLCPKKNHGDDCPICNFKDQLWKEFNDTQDQDTMKMAKDLSPRQRFFSPVLVRGEEADGIRVWGYGKEAYTSLLNLVLNPEYGDITDVDAGTDLTLTYGKPPGASFPKTTLTPRRRTGPLCDEAVGGDEECTRLLDNIPGFDNLFQVKTPDEVQQALDGFIASLEGDTESVASELVVNEGTPDVLQRVDRKLSNTSDRREAWVYRCLIFFNPKRKIMTTENNNSNDTTTTATEGTNATVHYKGTLEDGSEFDSSRTRGEPITFTVGSGQMIPGFNDAVSGMTVGETKTVTLTPDQAYGDVNPEAQTTFPKSGFPEGLDLVEGMPVPLKTPDGRTLIGRLSEQQDETVTIDLNHPLAGQTLQFEIELVEVTTTTDTSTDEEIAT